MTNTKLYFISYGSFHNNELILEWLIENEWSRLKKPQQIFDIIHLNVSISEWIDPINTLVVNPHFFSVVLQEEMVCQEVKALQEVQGKQEKMAVLENQEKMAVQEVKGLQEAQD